MFNFHPNNDLSPKDYKDICERTRGGEYLGNWKTTTLCISTVLIFLFILVFIVFFGPR